MNLINIFQLVTATNLKSIELRKRSKKDFYLLCQLEKRRKNAMIKQSWWKLKWFMKIRTNKQNAACLFSAWIKHSRIDIAHQYLYLLHHLTKRDLNFPDLILSSFLKIFNPISLSIFTHAAEGRLRFVRSRYGGKLLMVNNFTFTKNKRLPNGTTYWRCTIYSRRKKNPCQVRCQTRNGEILKVTSVHNHPPKKNKTKLK